MKFYVVNYWLRIFKLVSLSIIQSCYAIFLHLSIIGSVQLFDSNSLNQFYCFPIEGLKYSITMGHCTTSRCLTSCIRSTWLTYGLMYDELNLCINDVPPFLQADWKPESPDRFGEIAELAKSVASMKVEESKPQGSALYLEINASLFLKCFSGACSDLMYFHHFQGKLKKLLKLLQNPHL